MINREFKFMGALQRADSHDRRFDGERLFDDGRELRAIYDSLVAVAHGIDAVCEKLPNGNRVCGEVKAIGNGYVWLMNVQYKIRAEYLHHYHEPTVEDVLEELLREYDRDDSELTNGEIVEMFAKRLTLAGDGR